METKNLNFGKAIEALKEGKKIAREGWNGKNMYLYLNKGSYDKTSYHDPENVATHLGSSKLLISLFEVGDVGTITRNPNINMFTADKSIVTGWLASQTDILAEDWTILN